MANQKKIFIDVYYLKVALTGIRSYMLELVEELRCESTSHEIVIYPDFEQLRRDNSYLQSPSLISRLFFHVKYFWWKQFKLPLLVRREKADVLICPDYLAPIWPMKKIHKLVVMHDHMFWKYPQHYPQLWRLVYLRLIHWSLTGNAKIITTSAYTKGTLASIFKPADIHFIYQRHRALDDQTTPILEKLELQKRSYFLHVGFFEARKDLITLVKAFLPIQQHYKDLKLVLVGKTNYGKSHKVIDEIEAFISAQGLSEAVIMPGFLPKEDLPTLYKNALAYVFPSKDEGFGIPILEAFQFGAPVIVSDAGALKEIGGEAVVEFPVGDVVELSKVMKRFVGDEALRKNYMAKGKKRSLDFSKGTFGKGFLNIIDKLPSTAKGKR